MKYVVQCFLLLLPAMVWAQEKEENLVTAHAFTIADCIEYAKRHNVQVKNALLNVQIQQQTNRNITSAALPTISGNAAFTDYLQIPVSVIPGEIFGGAPGSFIPVKFGVKYNTNVGLNLQQLLFDGQVFVGLQARKASIEFQQKAYEVTAQAIRANIYKIYYQLVAAKTQLDILDANIVRAKKFESDAKALYKNGFAEKLDADRAAVQVANLEMQRMSVQTQIDNGYVGLKFLMGMPIKDSLLLTETISEDQLKEQLLDNNYDYNNRLEYQYAMLGKRLGEYNVKRYKLAYLPTVALSGTYVHQTQRNQFDMFKKGTPWFNTSIIGLNISVPIFDGFAKDANLRKAKLELQQTENNIADFKNQVDNEVKQAYNTYKNAILMLDNLKKNSNLAEQVYLQTKKKFESGLASNTDVTNTQADLITAQTNYINAMYTAIIAKVDYMKATGKLP
ncbi:MAG: TolC family protein [Chitinophagaceae bacterium]